MQYETGAIKTMSESGDDSGSDDDNGGDSARANAALKSCCSQTRSRI